MKYLKFILFIFFLSISPEIFAQGAETAFHNAAGLYVKGNIQDARNTVSAALQKYPSDPKLNTLWQKLQKEEPENQEKNKQEGDSEENKDRQDQGNQEEQESQKNDEQREDDEEVNKDQENKPEDADGQNEKEAAGEENEEGEKGEMEEMRSMPDKFKDMNLTEEKARMILEAMKNNEVQYIQQQRRKIRENSNYGKPDW